MLLYEREEVLKRIVSGVMLTLLLMGILKLAFNIQPVKAESIELYYDDGEANGGVAMPANRTYGWGVKFDHPEHETKYRVQSAKIYIPSIDGAEGSLRLFIYLYNPSVLLYEKVYENIASGLTQGWNLIDLTPYNIVTDQDFIIGVNWVADYIPWLGDDDDTECHSGAFYTTDTTSFSHYYGGNYMIRAYVKPLAITATIDIDPDNLNLISTGKWITTYIELPEGYNVANINVSSIMLNDTIPVDLEAPTEIGDYDNDSIPDLMVNFNRTALIEYILGQSITFGNVTLTVTGQLRDGIPFEGNTIIAVSDLAGDVNCDGVVDIYDVVEACLSYGFKEGEPNWNPNANVASPYDRIDIFDMVTIAYHYGETYP